MSKIYLDKKWGEVTAAAERRELEEPLGEGHPLLLLIRDCLTSVTKTYHYVLPTQLLAKSVAPDLDAHSLQVAYDAPGAFDARTVAHKIIVPFDRANHRVLGGSPEPYVNNPVRVPAVTQTYREQQKVKEDWDKLVFILGEVEEAGDELFTEQVFEQTLYEIYKLLTDVVVVYPTPNRISLDRTNHLPHQTVSYRWFRGRSNGDRLYCPISDHRREVWHI